MKKSSLLFALLSFTTFIAAQQKIPVKTQTVKPAETVQEPGVGKFTGTIFNDFLYILQEPQTGNLSKGASGRNASVLRRATLGYEYSFNKDVSAKVSYDGSSNTLKQGYAEVRNLVTMLDLKVGLGQTISSESVEKIWEYRSLGESVLDRKGFTQEFDMGLTFTGRANAQGTMYGKLAIYNGTGTAAENNKVKKIAFAAGDWLDKNSVVELYADYENLPSGKSTITAKVFYGMTAAKFSVGAEGFYRMNRKFVGTKDATPFGGSVFGWMEMMKATRIVVRVDGMDDDLNVSATGYREIYFNAGLDYAPVPEVHLIPNLAYVKNLKKGTGTAIADFIEIRLTTAVAIK